MSKTHFVVPFKKSDTKLQIAYGEVYLPNIPDSDGDFMTPEEIQKTAHQFLANQKGLNIDIEHDGNLIGAQVVESFIARKSDDTFVDGSWVVGVHINDAKVWEAVEKGDLSGFSMQGMATHVPAKLEMEIPEFVKGETDEVESHTHDFSVSFDEEGYYHGGVTSIANDGHFHNISKGTSTDKVNGHSHRFAFIEEWANV